MRKDTPNFSFEELEKSDIAKEKGIKNIIPHNLENNACKLLDLLQTIRDKFKYPIVINSGYRCQKLNEIVGGVSNSQHCVAEAADIISDSNETLWYIINDMIQNEEITVGQLINEYNFSWIHISIPTLRHKNEIFEIS